MLRECGWDDAAPRKAWEILRLGCSLDQLWCHTATYLENREKFDTPGAIWHRVSHGFWPVKKRIRDVDQDEANKIWNNQAATLAAEAKEQADREKRREERAERNRRERLAWNIVSDFKKSGDPDADDVAIKALLASHGLTWADANPSDCYRR